MDIRDKVIVITGAGSGIGRAMAQLFHAEGARHISVADLNASGAEQTAGMVDGLAFACDVTHEEEIGRLVAGTEAEAGPIDLFCSNAGVITIDPDFDNAASAPDAAWARAWAVHVMAHVYAARAVLPGMIERRSGWLLNTVSAAGLLSQIGSATYSATKHAAIGFAESLAIAHKDHGIGVSVLCPQGVATPFVTGDFFAGADVDGVLTPEAVAQSALEGLRAGRFAILPHPNVATYMRAKAENYDRWIGGMAKLRRSIKAGAVKAGAVMAGQ
jgi:NAD(P)-dependent dehydrogenase (short-subunit alcohol dehydrogenase family)